MAKKFKITAGFDSNDKVDAWRTHSLIKMFPSNGSSIQEEADSENESNVHVLSLVFPWALQNIPIIAILVG